MKTLTRSATYVLLLCASLALLPNANAILIGFEADEGYSTTGGTGGGGNLKGQPSSGTTWTNTSSGAGSLVTANAGTTGTDQALVANTTASGFYSFSPSNSDLGGTFDSDSSKINFSFDFNFLQTKISPALGVMIFRIGTTSGNALSFSAFNNGTITFSDGAATNHYAKTSGGGTFVAAANTYFNISGVLDYGLNSYTLSVNGVSQAIGGDSTFDFKAAATTADFNILSANSTASDWRPYAVDNINYAMVPEPSTAILLLLAAGALMGMRRRRK